MPEQLTFKGGSSCVYVIESNNGERWSLRISYDPYAAQLGARGILKLQRLKECSLQLKAPRVISQAKSYILLDSLESSEV